MPSVATVVLTCLSFMSYVTSWDLATTMEGSIEFFYYNGTKSDIVSPQYNHLTALAYDSVFQSLYFTDTRNDNVTIFEMNATNDIVSIVKKRIGDSVQGIAYDPVSGILFWTDGNNRSIFWVSLLPSSGKVSMGRILIQMTEETPQGIAVDSCRRFLYWTNSNYQRPTIERSRLDGSEREVLIVEDLFMPLGIAIDQVEGKMYWTDDKEGIYYRIESADLNGKNREIVYHGIHQEPYNIAVGVDAVYWTDWIYKSVWSYPFNANNGTKPTEIITFKGAPIGIIAKSNILNKITDNSTCAVLEEAFKNRTKMLEEQKVLKTEQEKTALISRMESLTENYKYCLNGGTINKNSENFICSCPIGFTGMRCGTSVCYNYCIEGSCTINNGGSPKCRCYPGYGGDRCQYDLCDGFCLNKGKCTVKDRNPRCACYGNFTGSRCELSGISDGSNGMVDCRNPLSIRDTENITANNNTPKLEKSREEAKSINSNEILYENDSQCIYSQVRDPVIIVLGGMCILLSSVCAFLGHKIMELKRRPRIRKRIIVNKNVTPLTARPESRTQCEITIENCCNMNICETPCFEPEGLHDNLPSDSRKKDEKKNLLGNMEHPEDLY